jgi:uncharacterized membrane protein
MSPVSKRVWGGLWSLAALLSVGVAIFSYRFLLPNPMMGEEIAANLARKPWLPIHAVLAATALLVGPFQFLPRLRARAPRVHRTLGKIYVFACLAAAPAGLILATHSAAGPVAQSGFGVLSVIWFAVTAFALRLAMTRRFAEHRRWMIRSFAMTFAAVTLRLYLPIPPMFLHMSFIEGYRAISWFCWTSNLLVAEIFLNWTTLRGLFNRPADTVLSAEAQ